MMTEPQPKQRSTKWRLAINFAIVFASFIVALTPVISPIAVVGLILAGFVYAATANDNSVERSIFTATGVAAAFQLLVIVIAFTLLAVVHTWVGWSFTISEESVSVLGHALLISPIGSLLLAVLAAAILGGIGGAMAEIARDGVVCRAITKARG